MKALLVVAHGSRREQSNTEIKELAQRIAAQAGQDFDLVECAFLELADPCLLYTSPSPRDRTRSRMPSSA